ncbi:hypothetical protein NMY22_g10232 [Coprinellus aureogranulatus]|nr:hypothetical protein NMY22_g10232 [Coprinellus aureogranulatus]
MIGDLQRRLDETSAQVAQMQLVIEEKDKIVVKMRKEVFESEAIRRKLHNTILELKGNIRVFARQIDEEEVEKVKARFAFPDEEEHKDIVLYSTSESAMGNERKEVYTFGFDRVFEPHSTQLEVFEEISQLAQSCVDGYNVCIFAYGQTGSGKSWTMEGGPTEDTAGMIPRAVEQVFRVAEEMKDKGWEYRIEGQFLEIYNETIHDLLTPFDASDKKKHEIKHDPKTGRTTVTELTVVPLTSPEQWGACWVEGYELFVFLKHVWERAGDFVQGTGERCEGCLNLVDLAGSERLNVSFGPGVTEKERVRETQSINKSLSALGDVIAALGAAGGSGASGNGGGAAGGVNGGNGGQNGNSLSGRSKTLMVLNLSPLQAHLSESLTSLRFATKVSLVYLRGSGSGLRYHALAVCRWTYLSRLLFRLYLCFIYRNLYYVNYLRLGVWCIPWLFCRWALILDVWAGVGSSDLMGWKKGSERSLVASTHVASLNPSLLSTSFSKSSPSNGDDRGPMVPKGLRHVSGNHQLNRVETDVVKKQIEDGRFRKRLCVQEPILEPERHEAHQPLDPARRKWAIRTEADLVPCGHLPPIPLSFDRIQCPHPSYMRAGLDEMEECNEGIGDLGEEVSGVGWEPGFLGDDRV